MRHFVDEYGSLVLSFAGAAVVVAVVLGFLMGGPFGDYIMETMGNSL